MLFVSFELDCDLADFEGLAEDDDETEENGKMFEEVSPSKKDASFLISRFPFSACGKTIEKQHG